MSKCFSSMVAISLVPLLAALFCNNVWSLSVHQREEAKQSFNSGVQFYMQNKFTEAKSAFTKALDADPDLVAAYLNRALTYDALNQYALGIKDNDQVLLLVPQYPQAYFNRGIEFYLLKQFKQALSDFTQAITLDSKNEKAYVNRADVYLKLNLPDLALKDLNIALNLNASDSDALFNRGMIYFASKKYQNAIHDFEQCDTDKPQSVEMYNLLGLAYYNLGMYDRSIEPLSHAISIDANFEDALNNRANAYEKLGQGDKANADRERISLLKSKSQ